MKRISALAVAVALLVACGKAPDQGYVRQKNFEPAHNESRTRQVYDGETCTQSPPIGKMPGSRNCTPVYHTEWYEEFVPAKWELKLEDCKKPDDCESGWKPVDETTYNRYEVGQHYPNPK